MLERPINHSRIPKDVVEEGLSTAQHGDQIAADKAHEKLHEMTTQLNSNDSFSKWLELHPLEEVKDVSLFNSDLTVHFSNDKMNPLIIHFNDKGRFQGQYVSMESDPGLFSSIQDFEGFKSWLHKFLIHIEATEISRSFILNEISLKHDKK